MRPLTVEVCMGTGTFDFNGDTIQALFVEDVMDAVSLESQILKHTHEWYRRWEIDACVHAEFGVLFNSGRVRHFRTSVPLPAPVVRACRQIVAELNWMNTIFPHRVERAKADILDELDCNEVRSLTYRARETARKEKQRFEILLNDALRDTPEEIVSMFMGHKEVLRLLR